MGRRYEVKKASPILVRFRFGTSKRDVWSAQNLTFRKDNAAFINGRVLRQRKADIAKNVADMWGSKLNPPYDNEDFNG